MRHPTRFNPPHHDRRFNLPTAPTVLLAALIGALIAAPACGALYKWTDAGGVVVYSDQPPPGNSKFETIAGPPPPANPNAVKELVNKETELKKQQTSAADTAKKTAQQRVETERLADTCRDQRAAVKSLAADQILVYSMNDKGEQVVLNDAERKRRRDAAEAFLKANCPPG
ncbi:MAG: DUF4124 domain-containing protein [Betaproteobacteria bacterium]